MSPIDQDTPESVFVLECEAWTEALLEHFIGGVRPGAPVFLSVDDEVLARIGRDLDRTVDQFLMLVRRRWVRRIQRCEQEARTEVVLDRSRFRVRGDYREYVTFLAAMVLAAQWMETEAVEACGTGGRTVVIDEKNYFQRLRQVLGLEWQREYGRPKGLKHYEEEDVWVWWNAWLEAQGRQPTARAGKTGSPHRYISYPLSQTMLRDGDRHRLAGWLWREARADISVRAFDRDRLLGWMLAHRSRLHLPRLWQILERPQDTLRFEATAQAAFDVYASIDWEEEPAEAMEGIARPVRRLTAGLYREEYPFIGEVRYSLYPRQPAEFVESALSVRLWGVTARLRPDRTGWFSPLPGGSSPPVSSLTMQVEGHPSIRELVFPEHDFWILVEDPLGPGGGACANWGPPMFERPFILLCRATLCHLLEHLRDLGVLDWRDAPVELLNGPWLEYRGCRIRSSGWRVRMSDLDASEEGLLRAIRPRTGGAIELNGGLKAPDRREGWMQDYLPSVSIQAVRGTAHVTVTNLHSQVSELCRDVAVGDDLDLPPLKPGYYRIDAALLDGGRDPFPGQPLPPRMLTVREWESLQCAVVTAEGTEE